jgi:ribosomal protein S18 acetylase RimI-like enzyme
VTPAAFYAPLVVQDLVWVAVDADRLVGFAVCEVFDDALHLWELAVRHEAQGRGAGRALVATAIAEARARRLPGVTLTTFRDIPWNAPFYARSGFRELAAEELNPRLTEVRAREAEHGLDISQRCAMRLEL